MRKMIVLVTLFLWTAAPSLASAPADCPPPLRPCLFVTYFHPTAYFGRCFSTSAALESWIHAEYLANTGQEWLAQYVSYPELQTAFAIVLDTEPVVLPASLERRLATLAK